MLIAGTNSRSLVEVMGLFFQNPTSKFYLREIQRTLKKPVGSIQRHLAKLESEGILKSKMEANLKYFSLDPDYRYFEELQSIVLKENRKARLEKNLKIFLQALKKNYHPEKIILFGSMATGKISPTADLDILIIKKNIPKRYWDRIKELAPLLINCDIGIDFVIWTPEEFSKETNDNLFIKEEIIKKGKILYDRAA